MFFNINSSYKSAYNDDYLYERPSPVDCKILKFVSIYLATIFFVGVVSNSLLLWILFSNKHLRTSLNIFMMALAFVNLMVALTDLPFTITSNYCCR